MLVLLVSSMLAVSVQDQLNGAEIGDATQFVSFKTSGSYYVERKEHSGRTQAKGTWRVHGDRLEVKVASCRGPSCDTLGKAWSAEVAIPAERAMTLRSDPHAALQSGSYYCSHGGCEKRIGVELVSRTQRSDVMKPVLQFLIDKNRSRNVTVVWIGDERTPPQTQTQVIWCARESDRARHGAELVAADLSELGWVGRPRVNKGPSDCLYDVRVIIGDGVQVSAAR